MAGPNSLLYTSKIKKINFSVLGDSDVRRGSSVEVKTHNLFKNGMPYQGGCYDAHLGTTEPNYNCATCGHKKKLCLGHAGHIQLNYPVLSPLFINEIKKWLKLTCFKCGMPIIDSKEILKLPKKKRLAEATKSAKSGNKRKECIHCKEPHPTIEFDKNDILFVAVRKNESGQDIESRKLYPHLIKEVLARISNKTVILLGKRPISHPQKFILSSIYVPGAPVRPDTKVVNGGRSKNDDLTTLLQNIIKENDEIPAMTGRQFAIDKDTEKRIIAINTFYYSFVKGAPGKKLVTGSSGQLMSLAARLKGKSGRFRRNQMGKRVVLCGRSVISGDPTLKLNEFGVSLKVARTLYVEEIVQPCNHKRLMTFFLNGTKRYPGAKKVIKARTGTEMLVDKLLEKNQTLELGDKLLRDLVTGDYACFNRQPSLSPSQIAAHKIVVYEDPNILTFRLNPLGLVLYHGDFDGDEMNLYVNTSIIARNEISQMSSVANWTISFSKSAPLVGQIDDSIIGSFECTRSGVEIDRYHAMLLFSGCTYLPEFTKPKYSGRDIMSLALAQTPITYSKTPNFYNQAYAPMLNYDPSEIKVEIVRGQIKSGVLDKAIVGKEKENSIYHVIANEYGNEVALDVMFNMQQIAINFNLIRGFSVGMNDIVLDKGTLSKIHEIESTIIKKANLITDRLQRGEIIPPIDQTVSDFYEDLQINELRVMDDFHEPVLSAVNPRSNALVKLILSGSKGTLNNMLHMNTCIGPPLVNGERARQTFSYRRTLPYFRRFETTPESRGYITNSYMAGLNSAEFMFAAMAARFDFISKALLTSVTGEQERKSVKNLESVIVNNHRMSVKNKNIIQWIYGEDGIDTRRVTRARFDTVAIATAKFEEKFRYPGKDPIFAAEFTQLEADRAKYREIFLGIEEGFFKELFSDNKLIGVDAGKALHIICVELEEMAKEPTEPELAQMAKIVAQFVEDVPYFMLNDWLHAKKAPVPEHLRSAVLLTQIHMRAALCSVVLKKEKCTPKILEVVLGAIKVKYKLALIEYGTAAGIIAAMSFCAPLTQYMLDSVHSAQRGGTNKSEMIHTKEVMSARSTLALQNPMMTVILKPEYERDEKKVRAIANSIEYMVFRQFVSVVRIFYEKFGEPVHPHFLEEKNTVIEQFRGLNPLLTPPADLTKWCIHFMLNKTTMILKNMNLELIIKRIREKFPNTFVVYSQENAPKVIIRVYIRPGSFNNLAHISEYDVQTLKDTILDTKIRGIEGVKQAKPVKLLRNKVTPEGEIVRDTGRWGIQTVGINMMGVMCHPAVDPYKVQTNSVEEIYKMLGVEAARAKLLMEIKDLGEGGLNLRHSSIFADEMSFTGKITSIEKGGLGIREPDNMLLRVGFSSPVQTLEEAGTNASSSTVSGLTAKLLVGSMPETGTTFNTFTINEGFVQANHKKTAQYMDA